MNMNDVKTETRVKCAIASGAICLSSGLLASMIGYATDWSVSNPIGFVITFTLLAILGLVGLILSIAWTFDVFD